VETPTAIQVNRPDALGIGNNNLSIRTVTKRGHFFL